MRRGERPAPHAGTPPPAREGRLAAALSAWQPARPRSAAARAAAAAWAAPLSVVGLLLGATSGGRGRWHADHGVLVFEGAHRGSAALLRAVGADANALGQVVVSRRAPTPPELLAHEAAHARQAERLGPLLPVVYCWLWARYGYRDHPLERAARQAATPATA